MGHRPATSKGLELLGAADAAAVRTAASLGSIATQDANNVSVSGGAISGVTLSGDDNFTMIPDIYTASHTLDSNDMFAVGNHATVAIVFTLPAASGSGKKYIVKRVGAAATSVVRAGSDTIDGGTSVALAQYESITLVDAASGMWSLV